MKKIFAIVAVMAITALGFVPAIYAQTNTYYYQGTNRAWMNAPVSQFVGKEVRGINGETLGTIQDFVMDQNGRVQYALVSPSTMSGRLVAVPFDALTFSGPELGYLSLNATPDQLANAPVYSLNNLSNRAWNDSVYRYYGVQPYWYDQNPPYYYGYAPQSQPMLPNEQLATGQTVPVEKYHNQSAGYEGFWNPGEEGLWHSGVNIAPEDREAPNY